MQGGKMFTGSRRCCTRKSGVSRKTIMSRCPAPAIRCVMIMYPTPSVSTNSAKSPCPPAFGGSEAAGAWAIPTNLYGPSGSAAVAMA